jgi:two-component system chemotaxis response regulator CheB
LLKLAAGLPADLPAAVMVALHLHPGFPSDLPDHLSRVGPLPACFAVHREPIAHGRIYVAPVDNHLGVRPGILQVTRGPKENGHRPSIDSLFRSASMVYGPRVIGVVLTGHLDCGTAGLLSIKARGGLTIVQDPEEAEAASMPRSAIEHVTIDEVAPLQDIPGLITRAVRQPPSAATRPVDPNLDNLEPKLAALEGRQLGETAPLVCPSCHGEMTEVEVNGFQRFRCHTGHAFSLASADAEQAEEVERALWAAIRALDESAALTRRLSIRSVPELRRRFADRSELATRQSALLRRLLLGAGVDSPAQATRGNPSGTEEPDA